MSKRIVTSISAGSPAPLPASRLLLELRVSLELRLSCVAVRVLASQDAPATVTASPALSRGASRSVVGLPERGRGPVAEVAGLLRLRLGEGVVKQHGLRLGQGVPDPVVARVPVGHVASAVCIVEGQMHLQSVMIALII